MLETVRKGTDFFTVRNGQLVELDPLEPGQRHFSTSLRSRQHVWPVLQCIVRDLHDRFRHLQQLHALEIGSGTGAHAEYFLAQQGSKRLVWQPTDYNFKGGTYNPDLSSLPLADRKRLLPLLAPFDASDARKWDAIVQETQKNDNGQAGSLSQVPIVTLTLVVTIAALSGTAMGLVASRTRSVGLLGIGLLVGLFHVLGKQSQIRGHCHEQSQRYQLVYAASLVHMCPWSCTLELFIGCSKILGAGGALVLYGPFRDTREGFGTYGNFQVMVRDAATDQQTMVSGFRSEGDATFHRLLRERKDYTWGFRDVKQMVELAALAGFDLTEAHDVGPNNFLLHFTRSSQEISTQAHQTIRSCGPA